MITVPSIHPATAAGGRRLLRKLVGRVALAEVRMDGIRSPDIRHLLGGNRPPVIVTYRSRIEGGKFTGSVRAAVTRLRDALAAGAEFIDVEERLGRKAIDVLSAAGGNGRIILSRHDPLRTPGNAVTVFRRMMKQKPAIVKYAARANSFKDTLQTARLLKMASKVRQPAVVISMGGYGAYTRVLQGYLGGAISFASFGPPTAPGQIEFGEMAELYRTGSINARTKIFGLLGDPVHLSPGVRFHNAIFARLNSDAVYLNFLVDDVGMFMSTFAGYCTGLSVTMPFKSAVVPFVDRMHASASLSGSVNTIVRRSGKTLGINTDYLAFTSLLKKLISPRGKHLVVIGTGGTARSVAASASATGARLTIAGRTTTKAKRLAKEFGGSWIPLSAIPEIGAEIIVNATPAGMVTSSNLKQNDRIVPRAALGGSPVVFDFANPPRGRTLLVREARGRGCRVVTGDELFRAQAVLQSGYFLNRVRST